MELTVGELIDKLKDVDPGLFIYVETDDGYGSANSVVIEADYNMVTITTEWGK